MVQCRRCRISRRWWRRSARRPACSASATYAWSSGSASTATTPRSSPATASTSWSAGRRSRRRSSRPTRTARARPRSSPTSPTCERWAAARWRSSTCWSAPTSEHAETVLDGIAWASDLLGVPVVGGHLTIGHPPALSASCTGVATRPLRGSNARPGDTLLAAFALDGRYMSDTRPFFSALHDRPAQKAPRRRRGARRGGGEGPLPRRARRLDARHRRLAAADDRGRRLRRHARPRPPPPPAPQRPRALAADVPELRVPARRPPGARRGRHRGLHPPRPRLRPVRRLRRHARAPPGRRRSGGSRVGPRRATPLTGLRPAGSPSAGA